MNTQQAEYILTVAQFRSFSKAAQKLYVTQPSLSQYVMKTEQKLGFAIFNRSQNPISVTPRGEIFIEYARQFLALEESMNNRLYDTDNLRTGSLRIGASSFRASCLLSKSITEFSKKYSGISISVTEDNSLRLAEMVKSNELDVIISAGDFNPTFFHTEEIAQERLFLAIPHGYSLNEKLTKYALSDKDIKNKSLRLLTAPILKLSEAENLPFIIVESGEFSNERISEIFKREEVTPEITLKVRTIETLFSFVNAGLGAALLPDTLIRFGNYSSHPIYYALDPEFTECAVKLCSRKGGGLSNAAKQYCLMLKQLVDIGTWRV